MACVPRSSPFTGHGPTRWSRARFSQIHPQHIAHSPMDRPRGGGVIGHRRLSQYRIRVRNHRARPSNRTAVEGGRPTAAIAAHVICPVGRGKTSSSAHSAPHVNQAIWARHFPPTRHKSSSHPWSNMFPRGSETSQTGTRFEIRRGGGCHKNEINETGTLSRGTRDE